MTTLTAASAQWAKRPTDERFTSLDDLLAYKRSVRDQSRAQVVSTRQLEAVPVQENDRGIAILADGKPTLPTHWSFSQIAQRADAPAGYLRKLRPDLAADCVNYGMAMRNVDDVGILITEDNAVPTLAAATGPNYGRVWDYDIARNVRDRFGNGVDGDFRIPGEFGKAVPITKANTTLYASDRDMFIFLADETNRIEMPNRRDGLMGSLARGFYIQNSEVGSATLSICTFLYDYVCCNRMIWGAEGVQEFSIRHTSGAPDRFIEEVAPALVNYANASDRGIREHVANAQAKRIEEVDDFLNARFTRSQSKAIQLAHIAEEGRPIETIWDAATGITAYAKSIEYQDERVAIERSAGKVFKLAA